MKTTYILPLKVILYFIILIVLIYNGGLCEADESYHIVMGLQQSLWYDAEFKFRNTPDDMPFITDFPMNELIEDPEIVKIERGAFQGDVVFEVYIKTEEEKIEKVWLRYWIHTSVSNAEEKLVESFSLSNLGRYNAIDIGREGEIGDNCWYSDYSIDFIRNNVQVQVCTYWTPPLPELIIKVSKKVDTLLIKAEKVNDASLIPAPIIQSVRILTEEINKEQHSIFFTLKVNADDPKNQHLRYWLSFFPRISDDGILEGGFLDKGINTFKIWVMNEDRIVSSKEVNFYLPSAVNDEDTAVESPQVFTLHRNAPNPFNPSTVIVYELYRSGWVSLRVYDLLGREVTALDEGEKSAGRHEAVWDGRNVSGIPAPSGVYLYRLESGGQAETGKMTLLR